MKLLISFAFITLICSSFVMDGAPGKETKTTTFKHSDYTIELPAGWELNESGIMGTHFTSLSPMSSPNDQFRENMNVISENLNGLTIDLEEYTELSLSNIEKALTNFELIDKSHTTIGGEKATAITYKGTSGVYNLLFQQYLLLHGGNAYIITFTGEPKEFDKYLSQAQHSAKSFRFR